MFWQFIKDVLLIILWTLMVFCCGSAFGVDAQKKKDEKNITDSMNAIDDIIKGLKAAKNDKSAEDSSEKQWEEILNSNNDQKND